MEEFKYTVLKELTRGELKSRLKELEAHLRTILPIGSHEEFFDGTHKVIELLKTYGYELYMHDYNGQDLEIWGGDYTKPETACKLIVNFDLKNGINLEWENYLYAVKK